MDRILMEGLVFFGHHGALAAERETGALFTVDLILELNLAPAGTSDALADTVDYRRAYEIVRGVVEGSPRKLIEAIAETIAFLLLELEPIRSVTVRVNKKPALGGEFRTIAVEVTRP